MLRRLQLWFPYYFICKGESYHFPFRRDGWLEYTGIDTVSLWVDDD